MLSKVLIIILSAILFVKLPSAQPADSLQPENPKMTGEATSVLYNEIFRADSTLFNAFNHCDSVTYQQYFTDDLEFYHDLGGLTVSLKNELQSFKDMCKRGTHLRRELIKSSLEVHPIQEYGAVEIGSHRFYHTNPGEKEKLSGIYRFVHVWHKNNGKWKIARVISYGHDQMKNN
jgi:ketosteroid isomerase-like protein